MEYRANLKPWHYIRGLIVVEYTLYQSKVFFHLEMKFLDQIMIGFWGNLKSGILWDFFEYPGGIKNFYIIFLKKIYLEKY